MPETVFQMTTRHYSGHEETREVALAPGESTEVVLDTEVVEIEVGSTAPDWWRHRPTDPADLWDRYHNEGQQQEEIAADLGVAPSTVSRWMSRAGIDTDDTNTPTEE